MINGYTKIGEWWRFVTPIFIHLSFLHILMNGIMLYYLGTDLEKILGHTKFLVIFLIAGIFGNFASFCFNAYPSAGASTSLFGLLGVYLMLNNGYRFTILDSRSIFYLILSNIVLDFISPNIDLYGHIGGLIGGFLSSYALYSSISSNKLSYIKRILAIIILLMIASYCLGNGGYGEIN